MPTKYINQQNCDKKITPATKKRGAIECRGTINRMLHRQRCWRFRYERGSQQKVKLWINGTWNRRYVESLLGHIEFDAPCATTRKRTVSRR